MNKQNGLLIVISSPSGGGKTTIINRVIGSNPEYIYSVSMTTRKLRQGEVDGRDYMFVSEKDFMDSVKNGNLIEYENVHGCYYGTPLKKVSEWIEEGKTVFLDLDVYGALKVKRMFGKKALLVFLMPPDNKVLLERLINRSTENKQQIEKRLSRLPEEMKLAEKFDKIIINEHLDDAVDQVKMLVEQTKLALKFSEEL